jgi:hypothetical protein
MVLCTQKLRRTRRPCVRRVLLGIAAALKFDGTDDMPTYVHDTSCQGTMVYLKIYIYICIAGTTLGVISLAETDRVALSYHVPPHGSGISCQLCRLMPLQNLSPLHTTIKRDSPDALHACGAYRAKEDLICGSLAPAASHES